jgi:ankyrin repeat protein
MPSFLPFFARIGYRNLVQTLLNTSADVNALGGGENGTALHSASLAGHLDLVNLLIECGADVNAGGGYYGHPLLAACFHHQYEIVKALVEHGADVNAQGKYGNPLKTVRHWPNYTDEAKQTFKMIEQYLIQHGTREP